MEFRTAVKEDIVDIIKVRHSVLENESSNPELITEQLCLDYLEHRGKGWVCEVNNQIVGFSIVDLEENSIWALFLLPEYEKQGIGRTLHTIMLDWYFEQTKLSVWLGTTPKTRAESFYRKAGWVELGIHGDGEIKFEMSYINWMNRKD